MLRAINQFKIDHPYVTGAANVISELLQAGAILAVAGIAFLLVACSFTYCGGPVF